MAGMGSEVTIIEKESQLLPSADHELALEVRKMLERQSVRVLIGNGSYKEIAGRSEKVLVAVGRKPDVSALGLAAAGITFSGKGIEVNEYLETNIPGVYAAGDVTGKNYLAYVSQAEGVCAAENAHGSKNTVNSSAIPWAVFTDPPAAGAGAREKDFTRELVSVGRFPLAANSRSMIESERYGWAKIISEKNTGKILGGWLIGPGADEIIPVLALAVRHGLTVKEMSRELFFHPSISESLHCACEDAVNKCVDLPGKETK
jgi:dihydrolipoamide dehydrogenase